MNIRSKNGIIVKPGMTMVAGPNNPYDTTGWWFVVVNPQKGRLICMHNNVEFWEAEQFLEYYVVTRDLMEEDWFSHGYNPQHEWSDKALINEILAGITEGERFCLFMG